MCVAIYKPCGVDAPSGETLRLCWTRNPHGAGYAFRRDDGKVEWVKGFMTFESFMACFENIANVRDKDMMIHFRIGTSGGNTPGNTHPFPITEDVALLKSTCGIADEVMMHNGVLSIKERSEDISDTMELAIRIAEAGCGAKSAFGLLSGLVGADKLFAFTKDGGHSMLGAWSEIDGVYFSNLNWKNRIVKWAGLTSLYPPEWFRTKTETPKKTTANVSKKKLKELARDMYGKTDKHTMQYVKHAVDTFCKRHGGFNQAEFEKCMDNWLPF